MYAWLLGLFGWLIWGWGVFFFFLRFFFVVVTGRCRTGGAFCNGTSTCRSRKKKKKPDGNLRNNRLNSRCRLCYFKCHFPQPGKFFPLSLSLSLAFSPPPSLPTKDVSFLCAQRRTLVARQTPERVGGGERGEEGEGRDRKREEGERERGGPRWMEILFSPG